MPEARFWGYVKKGPNCWEWQRARKRGGYGVFKMSGKMHAAQRVAWKFTHGNIPNDLCVLHHCDNPPCVRPDHLWLGTNLDNVKDRDSKKRQASGGRNGMRTHPERIARGIRSGAHTHPEKRPRGEKNGRAKLTAEKVREIRQLHGKTNLIQGRLAKIFGVSRAIINRIVLRKSWKHIE